MNRFSGSGPQGDEQACMHESGCTHKATRFQEDAAHWHDWIWCDEHAQGKNTEPLDEGT